MKGAWVPTVIALALTLSGCGIAALHTLQAQDKICRAQYPWAVGTARDQAVCLKDAFDADGRGDAAEEYFVTERVYLAGLVDSGRVSADEAAAEIAGLKAQLVNYEMQQEQQADQDRLEWENLGVQGVQMMH